MAKEKIKKVKQEKYRSEEQMEIIRFIRILIIVVVLILGIYFITEIFIKEDSKNNENEITEGKINYDKILIGSILNKPEKEYYVLIYNSENLRAAYYSGIASKYLQNKEHLRVYYADLNNKLNQDFYDQENVNLNVSDIKDLKVGDVALIKVKDGKIIKAIGTEEEIAEELKYIESEDTEK